jgi:hypothetical protein
MKYLFTLFIILFGLKAIAQTDTIFTKGNEQILCTKIKETKEQYSFTFLTVSNTKEKSSILKYLVDSIKHFVPIADTSKLAKKIKKKTNNSCGRTNG